MPANLNADEQKLQAMEMVQLRIKGMNIAQLAAHYGCSVQTVERRLALARREKLLQKAADQFINALPKVFDTYSRVLNSLDDKLALEAARDIAFGTGTLSKQNRAQVAPQEKKELTLRAWREKRLADGKRTHPTAHKQPRTPLGPESAAAPAVDEEVSVLEATLSTTASLPTGDFEDDLETELSDGDEPALDAEISEAE